jgi:hypothetical protein
VITVASLVEVVCTPVSELTFVTTALTFTRFARRSARR